MLVINRQVSFKSNFKLYTFPDTSLKASYLCISIT